MKSIGGYHYLFVLMGLLGQGNACGDAPALITELIQFKDPAAAVQIHTDGTITNVNGQKQALEILFPTDPYMPVIDFKPEHPWDWSGLEEFNIAITAKNTGNSSVQLYLGLTDVHGVFANRCITLSPGEAGTYYAVLSGRFLETDSGMRESPPPWDSSEEMFVFRWGNKKMDLAAVEKLTLFTRGTVSDKKVVLERVCLRRNLDYDLSYLEAFVDEFGQNAKLDYSIKVDSLEELESVAKTELAELANSKPLPDRSRFGGWKDGPRREATGYFRTENVDGKWWMVDPEGYLFFSHGLANVRMENLSTFTGVEFRDPAARESDPEDVTPIDSVGGIAVSDATRNTRYVASPLRRNMFTWLPGYDDALSEHYSYRRAAHLGPMASGETYSFYRANLERRYGQTTPNSYIKQWEDVTLSRMLDWGFTSMGNWVDPAFYPNRRVPYFANGWIIGDFKTLSSIHDVWAPMPDVFDPEFVRRTEVTINTIAEEIKGSPWCVGVFVDNEKSWGAREGTVRQRYGLVLAALSQPANESPSKNAFVKLMHVKYGDIAVLNKAWGSSFTSWEEFSEGFERAEYTTGAIEDLSAMLAALSDEYFRVVRDTLEKTLPNHLYMGARLASWGMPAETVRAAVKYSDVLSFNIYQDGLSPKEWTFLYDIDLPTIIGEFHIGATTDTGLYHGGLVQAETQADRARMYTEYMESVAAHGTMVGAHWFQYVDSPITGRAYDGESYNVGFVSVTDRPYPEMVTAAKAFNKTLYLKRFGAVKAAME